METCSRKRATELIHSPNPPRSLRVLDHLVIKNSNIESLPELEVNGDLIIQNCVRLKALPPRIKVAGRLVIDACDQIEVIESKLIVNGETAINDCANLREIR